METNATLKNAAKDTAAARQAARADNGFPPSNETDTQKSDYSRGYDEGYAQGSRAFAEQIGKLLSTPHVPRVMLQDIRNHVIRKLR